MTNFQDQDHWLMLTWMTVMGFVAFGLVVCWNEGLLSLLYASDRSHISLVIGLLYVIGTIHCARRARFLSKETDTVRGLSERLGDRRAEISLKDENNVLVDGHSLSTASVVGDHLRALIRRGESLGEQSDNDQTSAVGTMIARAKGSHDMGWFLVDVLLKLGLLGTIVGFILMLGSVADTASLDVNTMQKVLKQMSNGMGTALYTTMAGLVGSMSLGFQYLLLDKGADDLIERVLRLADSHIAVR